MGDLSCEHRWAARRRHGGGTGRHTAGSPGGCTGGDTGSRPRAGSRDRSSLALVCSASSIWCVCVCVCVRVCVRACVRACVCVSAMLCNASSSCHQHQARQMVNKRHQHQARRMVNTADGEYLDLRSRGRILGSEKQGANTWIREAGGEYLDLRSSRRILGSEKQTANTWI